MNFYFKKDIHIEFSPVEILLISEQGSHLLAIEGTLGNALFRCSHYTDRLTQLSW